MAKYNLTKTDWTPIGIGVVQARYGRIRIAASATPDDEDFLVMGSGDTFEVDVAMFAQAIDQDAIAVVL